MYEFFRKYKFVNIVSVKNANQSNSINTNQWKKTNTMLTIKFPFHYYIIKLIKYMMSNYLFHYIYLIFILFFHKIFKETVFSWDRSFGSAKIIFKKKVTVLKTNCGKKIENFWKQTRALLLLSSFINIIFIIWVCLDERKWRKMKGEIQIIENEGGIIYIILVKVSISPKFERLKKKKKLLFSFLYVLFFS